MLPIGVRAPDFELTDQHRQTVRLSSYRGRKNVVIAFHPLAFTPVCSAQLQCYEREQTMFEGLDAEVLSISFDLGPSKKAWADSLGGISHHMLSDFHPHGAVAAAYGAKREDGLPERALFVVDKQGVIRWAMRYEIPEHPPLEDLADALRAVQDAER